MEPGPDWRTALTALQAELEARERATRDDVVANLVTAVEIAAEHGWESPNTVHTYVARGADFPAPVRRFGRVNVYWKPDVDAWFASVSGKLRSGAAS